MKKIILVLLMAIVSMGISFAQEIEELDYDSFQEKVFVFANVGPWEFSAEKHVVVVFGADWCSPCNMYASVLKEAKELYGDQIQFYKVDVEEEVEIVQSLQLSFFAIQNIPTTLYIPKDGAQPWIEEGSLSLDMLKTRFDQLFKIKTE